MHGLYPFVSIDLDSILLKNMYDLFIVCLFIYEPLRFESYSNDLCSGVVNLGSYGFIFGDLKSKL